MEDISAFDPQPTIIGNVIAVPFRFSYSRSGVPSINEIIESLQGVDAIMRRTPKAMKKLIGIDISGVSVSVNFIKTGSLYDDIVVNFMFGGRKQMDLFLKEMHEKFMNHKVIPVLVFLALLGGGALSVYKFSSIPGASNPIINSYNTNIINIIASDSGKSVESVQKILDSVVPKSEEVKLAKESLKVLAAARAGGDIKVNGDMHIDSAFISAVPVWKDMDKIEDILNLENTDANIRAVDIDSSTNGWAVVIPAVGKKRIKMLFAEGVDKSKIVLGKPMKVDVSVLYEIRNDEKIPYRCILSAIK